MEKLPPIEWETLEHPYKPKTADWFWAVGIISVSIAILSIILGNMLFAIIILLGAFTLSTQANKKPKSVYVKIDGSGILFGKYKYQYPSLGSFWIEEHPAKKLLVKSRKTFMPLIVITIDENINLDDLRHFLNEYMPQEEMTEHFTQKVMEYLGF